MKRHNKSKNSGEPLNYWQSTADMMSALLLILLLVIMLLLLYIIQIPEEDYIDLYPGSSSSQAASYGLTDLLELLVLITVNLGVFNLLPIPALDGGRLVFLAVEAVLRRPVSQRVQENLTLATFILLFGLMIFATYNDVLRLITGA